MEPTERDEEPYCAEADTVAESQQVAGRLRLSAARTFSSLFHRDFLLFWAGAWLSNIGNWLQSVALGWLVLEMTNSEVMLGMINFAASLPVFLFSFAAGIWADKHDKRRLILAAQVILMCLAIVLGGLISSGSQTVWIILVLAFAAGMASAFSFPAWQALISEIVPKKDLLNAIALNSAQFQAARLIGPALAGYMIHAYGVSSCFYLNAVSFLAVIGALLLIRPQRAGRTPISSDRAAFFEGLAHLRSNPRAIQILVLVGLVSTFGMSFYIVLMPKIARDVLGGDASTLGTLMGAAGFGALTGALVVATLAAHVRPSIMIRGGLISFSITLLIFSFSRSIPLSMACLAVIGFSILTLISTLNTSLQTSVPQQVRGRVMSFFVWVFMGWMPVGSLLAGWTARLIGPAQAIGAAALVPLAAAVWLLFRPSLLDVRNCP